uniref:Serine/threonine protein kinase n=1 Tax=Peronospora matthiolae TaxID=2874970 RepID=A0AAV1UNV8_9STRA
MKISRTAPHDCDVDTGELEALHLRDTQSGRKCPPSIASKNCDECEQKRAEFSCDDCGLQYCATCDTHRHRKGKLQFHERQQIPRSRIPKVEKAETEANPSLDVAEWKICDVCDWLEAHDLGLFVDEAQRQKLTGEMLRSLDGAHAFVEAAAGVSRGHKKKLLREVLKLQSVVARSPCKRVIASEAVPLPPIQGTGNSRRPIGFDVRVDVESGVAPPPPRRGFGLGSLGLKPLKIDVTDGASGDAVGVVKRGRGGRQMLGLDLALVKCDEKTVAASFDFSATGTLQTQGFEIDTRGIANVPFASSQQYQANEKKSRSSADAISTKEYLLMLEELGHGAGGKVYKALYMPTFMLVAVKIIRVHDQKKRHQMVRELKSLYVNFVPLASAAFPSTSAATSSVARAACEELVIFYDAYTNPELGSVSIVLEYMDGGSLEDYVQSAINGDGRKEGCLSEKEIANVAACGLKGLAFLHEHHQLHRDIKLSNMLINYQGQVKISDFGISRDLESTLAKATTFTGTLLYMAPERISGGTYSYPSDIWSFGLAIMACAIGKLPVPSKEGYWGVVQAVQEQPSPRLQDYDDRFSPELCDFLDQCLQKNPMYRPPAAILLEHSFIKKHFLPKEQTNVRLSRDRRPRTAEALERSRQEMRTIASKAHSWCLDHADVFQCLSSTSGVNGSQVTSSKRKIEVLAEQLHLPVDEVAPHFTFLDEFCT